MACTSFWQTSERSLYRSIQYIIYTLEWSWTILSHRTLRTLRINPHCPDPEGWHNFASQVCNGSPEAISSHIFILFCTVGGRSGRRWVGAAAESLRCMPRSSWTKRNIKSDASSFKETNLIVLQNIAIPCHSSHIKVWCYRYFKRPGFLVRIFLTLRAPLGPWVMQDMSRAADGAWQIWC